MRLTRRECIASLAALGVAGCEASKSGSLATPPAGAVIAPSKKTGTQSMAPLQTFTPENFGAAGDGQTNDTDAFIRMAAAVNAARGGTVVLRQTTYVVGQQVRDSSGIWACAPATIMSFDGCSKGLAILGNGARLLCQDGLRYGTFDPITGLATEHPMPFYGTNECSSPYVAMISIQECTAKVYVENIDLDGNSAGLSLGGPYGDTGWQLPAFGIQLINNTGGEHLVDVHSHHHAQDGIYLNGIPGKTAATWLENVVSEYNGRQGCSIVGGSTYVFVNCKFNHTGRGRIVSAPGAGVDIEAESSTIRDLSFTGCEFSNNSGVGMVADSGDSEGATFADCLFVGTSAWSAWPSKPKFSFANCRFVGSICHAFADTDPSRACQFSGCAFLDDPALSPSGEVFGGFIADLGSGDTNVLFDSCKFDLKHANMLPWTDFAGFKDCTMSQSAVGQAYPRGTFTGVNNINGNVDLYSSKVIGQLTVNGQVVPPTDFITW
jgi:hypothetical protein